MTTISSTGIGSGLDVSSIISKLMAAESQPLTQLQTDATKIQNKISVYGKIQSYASALRDAAQTLADTSSWSKTTAATSDAGVFTATSSTGGTAGSYAVQVNALAQGQTVYSAPLTSATSTVGSGTLTLQLGQWSSDDTSFTAKSGSSALNISVSATDTLTDVRNKINAAGAGVTASIVTDASGSKLVMRSSDTGATNGFRVTVADDDGAQDASGLSAFAYDPAGGAAQMTRSQTAANASALVDGIAVTSETNKIEGVIAGVTLQLTGVSDAGKSSSLTLTDDTASMQSNVEAFVKAYNDLTTYMSSQTKYDATTKKGALLQGDSGTNNLISSMRALATSVGGTSATYKQLFQAGIDTNTDGTLKINTTKLQAALASPDEMQKLFSANGASSTDDGIAAKLKTWSNALLSFDGAVTTRTQSLQTQLSDNSKKQDDFQARLDRIQTQLQKQYSALDTTMSSMNALSSYVSQQVTSWNKSS